MVRRAGSLETCGFKQTFWSLLGLRPKVTRARGRGTFLAGGTGDKRTGRRGRRPLRSKASPRSIRQRQRGQKYKRFPAEPFCAAVVIGERKSKNRRFLAAFFSIFLSLLKEIWPPEASKRKGSMSLRPKVTRARGRGTFPAGGIKEKRQQVAAAKSDPRSGARSIPFEKRIAGRRGRRPLPCAGTEPRRNERGRGRTSVRQTFPAII